MSASGDKPKPRSTSAAAPYVPDGAGAPPAGQHGPASEGETAAAHDPAGRQSQNQPDIPLQPTADARAQAAKPEAPHDEPLYTMGEEIANAVTHGLGALLGVAALVLLIVKAVADGAEPVRLASAIVFGTSLILEYSASTLYHAITYPPVKRILRIVDHSCIYLLIAGSYTPFVLGPLLPHGGLVIFGIVWVMALAGIIAELFLRERQPRWLTVTIYLVMGWLVVFQLPTLIAVLALPCLVLLAAGGLCYTVGTAFYLMKHIRYMHSVWHLWVLAGSICQFLAVILFVI